MIPTNLSRPPGRKTLLLVLIGAYDIVALVCLVYLLSAAFAWILEAHRSRLSEQIERPRPAVQQMYLFSGLPRTEAPGFTLLQKEVKA